MTTLDAGDLDRLLERRFPGHAFPPALAGSLAAITAGAPPFVASLLDELVGRGVLAERAGRWSVAGTLDELAASIVGEELATGLRELLREAGAGRGAPGKLARWHRAAAERLEATYGARAVELASALAGHYERGQDAARAVHYYALAGERAASADALELFRSARALVGRLPPDLGRDATELRVLVGLAQAVMRTTDDTNREPVALLEQMIALARRLGDLPQVCTALVNMSLRYASLAEYRRASDICDEVDALIASTALPASIVAFAKAARAVSAMWQGELVRAAALLEEITAAEQADLAPAALGAADRATLMITYLAVVRWQLGQADRAMADARRAVERAQVSGDPYTLGAALCSLARMHFWRGDPIAAVREPARAVLELPEAAVWHTQASLLVGWARSREAPLDAAALDALEAELRAQSAKLPMGTTFMGVTFVETLRASGATARAATLAEEMLGFAHGHGELLFEAEFLRLRGELADSAEVAASAYRESLALAAAAGARVLALRAACRLGAAWRDTPRRAEGHALVAAALAGISEGHELRELVEARALLAAL